MAFSSFEGFLSMGGYGFYVWLSVAICVFSIVGLWLASVSSRRALIKEIAQEIQRKQRISKAKLQFEKRPSSEVSHESTS